MIYSYNTLGIYETKANRQYDNTGNIRVLHHFETNKIPAFQIIVTGTIITASYKLFDINDVQVSTGSVTVENDTNDAGTVYSRLIFLGATLTSKDDGFYYVEITYDASKLYTDVFCWKTDVSEYLKIEATTADISISSLKMNMTGFTYLVYLEVRKNGFREEYDVEEEGDSKTYGNIPYYNSRNHAQEFEITGYRKTLNFLAGLRVVATNGTVTITYKNDSNEIYDIETADTAQNFSYSDILIINWKFKLKDYLQPMNDV